MNPKQLLFRRVRPFEGEAANGLLTLVRVHVHAVLAAERFLDARQLLFVYAGEDERVAAGHELP